MVQRLEAAARDFEDVVSMALLAAGPRVVLEAGQRIGGVSSGVRSARGGARSVRTGEAADAGQVIRGHRQFEDVQRALDLLQQARHVGQPRGPSWFRRRRRRPGARRRSWRWPRAPKCRAPCATQLAITSSAPASVPNRARPGRRARRRRTAARRRCRAARLPRPGVRRPRSKRSAPSCSATRWRALPRPSMPSVGNPVQRFDLRLQVGDIAAAGAQVQVEARPDPQQVFLPSAQRRRCRAGRDCGR